LEGGHRLATPVVAEDELIQVRLELSPADAMVGADQPLLKVADRAIRERDYRGLPPTQVSRMGLLAGHVAVARLPQRENPLISSVMIVVPAAMFGRANASIVAPVKSGMTSKRNRPEAFPRRSTAATTGAARRPFS
jgi:hypothetical protein